MKYLILPILALVSLCGCVTQQQVEADLFMHDQLPIEYCAPDSKLWNFGVYRVVECKPGSTVPQCQNGEKTYQEFRPYCEPSIKDMVAMTREDLKKWMDLLIKQPAKP